MRALDATVETVQARRRDAQHPDRRVPPRCRATRRTSRPTLRARRADHRGRPCPSRSAARSIYRKVRDRASYAFALVSVAADRAAGRQRPRRAGRRRAQAVARRSRRSRAAARRQGRDGRLLAGAKPTARERVQGDAGRAHARRGAGAKRRADAMKFDTPATTNPIDQLKVVGQRHRPHRRPAQDHRHRALRLRAARRRAERRPMAMSSARPSPRAASRRWTSTRAEAAPGVLAIVTAENAGKLGKARLQHRQAAGRSGDRALSPGRSRVVVAETFEQARAAAATGPRRLCARRGRIRSRGGARTPRQACRRLRRPADTAVGDFDGAFAAAPVKLDATYTTPDQAHAMMEPHASIAAWDGDKLTLWTVEPDDRLERGRHGQDARHPQGEGPPDLALHRRRLRRQAVPARRRAAGRARRARGRSGR